MADDSVHRLTAALQARAQHLVEAMQKQVTLMNEVCALKGEVAVLTNRLAAAQAAIQESAAAASGPSTNGAAMDIASTPAEVDAV